MGDGSDSGASEVSTLDYEADLCGNIEQALKGLQGYGIMALELIQNADDAGASELVFDARPDALVVRNDASFSTCGTLKGRCSWQQTGDPDGRRRPCNFHAISRMGSRNKIGAPGQIGRFGIGFVSVYQITDTPIVRAAGTQLTLNPLTGKGSVTSITDSGGTEFELPWASSASDIRAALNESPTPPTVASSVVAEIIAVLESSLLFLRNLRHVEVRENGQPRVSIDIERLGDHLTLKFSPGGRRQWLVLSGDASGAIEREGLNTKFEALDKLDRSRVVSVAVPVDCEKIEGRLFAYLPTQHPTGLPIHVNADFFPHASRQDIVLKGVGHERYWNESLITAAAETIGQNFITLRDTLGPLRLWEFGTAALKMKGQGAFGAFWTTFAVAASNTPSVWTISATWHAPEDVHLAPEEMTGAEQHAIVGIGLELADPTLRPHANALAAIGAGELRLSRVTTALEERQGEGITPANAQLEGLWSAIMRLTEISQKRTGFAAVLIRLKAATFVLDVDGNAASPDGLWRLPPKVRWEDVRRFIDDCPVVSDRAAAVPGIAELIDEMGLDDLASTLATAIHSDEDAERIIGPDPSDARRLYGLLTAFAEHLPGAKTGAILSDTPILRTGRGFIQPSRAQLPGHFRDPSGYFELVDTGMFPPGMDEFARSTLGVDVLSFHQYIDNHLPTILERGLERHQYREIVAQITTRKNELSERGSLDKLSHIAFVRTRAGTYVRPSDCYYWTAPLEAILGDNPSHWVDPSWMPSSPLSPQVQDLLESWLGMPTTVMPRHIVDRLEVMAADGTPDEVAENVTPIIRHVLERWTRFDEDDLETFRELQYLQFLPAIVSGVRDTEQLYLPGDVFRVARAKGFDSQVPVIDLKPLRQASATVGAFLDLLEVPDEPETAVVVKHLRHCMADETTPSDITYAILNERVGERNDVASIIALQGMRFIYDHDLKHFVSADEVFWLPPPFKGYWWHATGRMGQLSDLFRLLGVQDEPTVSNYVALMLEIAARHDLTERDLETHARCLTHLCEAVDADSPELNDAIEALRSDGSLLTVDGEAVWPEDAIWLDSDQLAQPFGSALNQSLVAPPDAATSSVARLFRLLGVCPLSSIAQLRLASEPDRRAADSDTALLRERADLILWVAPNAPLRSALRDLLRDIEIQLTDSLRIQAEIASFDPPVTSPVTNVPAFYERERGVLHIEGRLARKHWPAAFRAMFAEVERHAPIVDMKPLVTTATLIMKSESWEEAEEALIDSGFRAPNRDDLQEESGGALGEEQEDILEIDEAVEDIESEPHPSDDHRGDNDNRGGAFDDDISFDDDVDDESPTVRDNQASAAAVAVGGQSLDGEPPEENYKSKAGSGGIGLAAEENETERGEVSRGANEGLATSLGPHRAPSKDNGSRERRARTSRMRSYVAREGDRTGDDTHPADDDGDIGGLVDVAAVAAVVKYEMRRGWTPEVQPHNNPGYDIVSISPVGERRLIEVKGLENNWTERGVKLSHVQFGMAEQHPLEYWIYVVERARDLTQQRVNAIANPFQKVEEYWFDDAWRALSDESAGSQELNLTVGAKVRHQIWGTGTIIEVKKSAFKISLKIDFGYEGTKLVPFNSTIELVG
jgi:hypothetical protein